MKALIMPAIMDATSFALIFVSFATANIYLLPIAIALGLSAMFFARKAISG